MRYTRVEQECGAYVTLLGWLVASHVIAYGSSSAVVAVSGSEAVVVAVIVT